MFSNFTMLECFPQKRAEQKKNNKQRYSLKVYSIVLKLCCSQIFKI